VTLGSIGGHYSFEALGVHPQDQSDWSCSTRYPIAIAGTGGLKNKLMSLGVEGRDAQ
jgi:hypothetical protein